jgi:ATP-dependent Lon protease
MLRTLILNYTREAGVRSLERELAKICRKVALKIASGEAKSEKVDTEKKLEDYLSVRKFDMAEERTNGQVGVATGMVWTSVGGDIQVIETEKMPGKGVLILTGYLGEVMKESCQAAMTYLRSNAKALGINPEEFSTVDVHIHFPAGAIPKDGPSAGITIATALVSLFTGVRVKHGLAMTGEITLKGRVLPIGGLKEKILGAKRAGIHHVVVPLRNEKDIKEVPPEITKGMEFTFVKHLDEVLDHAFISDPRHQYEHKGAPKAEPDTTSRPKPAVKKPAAAKPKAGPKKAAKTVAKKPARKPKR